MTGAAQSSDVRPGGADYFRNLPELNDFLEVVDERHYHDVPDDWLVVITDVRGSTQAIEGGRYKDVNAVGAAGIIALRNALPHVELPFVFGGDGATILVPGRHCDDAAAVLRGLRRLAHEVFELELRCGMVPVRELRESGGQVRVARYRTSPHVAFAMFMGAGFSLAESWIKDEARGGRYAIAEGVEVPADLEGFECRWRPVRSTRGTMVSLLVQALGASPQEKAKRYRSLLEGLTAVLGDGAGMPVARTALKMQGLFGDFSVEARIKTGSADGPAYDRAVAFARRRTVIGQMLVMSGQSAGGFDGKSYPLQFIANCDFRKFDETLRMVIDVNESQLEQLTQLLEAARSRGMAVYGLHASKQALVTCFVRSYDGDHIHFVDGSDGGYALAAKQLKHQLAPS